VESPYNKCRSFARGSCAYKLYCKSVSDKNNLHYHVHRHRTSVTRE